MTVCVISGYSCTPYRQMEIPCVEPTDTVRATQSNASRTVRTSSHTSPSPVCCLTQLASSYSTHLLNLHSKASKRPLSSCHWPALRQCGM